MATFRSFVLVDNGGTGDVTVVPTSSANGVYELLSANSRSQAYRVTLSYRQSGASNRRYTIKLDIPKEDTQIINGVELPVSAWKSYASIDLTIPIYASMDDATIVAKSLAGLFKSGNPVYEAVSTLSGFWS